MGLHDYQKNNGKRFIIGCRRWWCWSIFLTFHMFHWKSVLVLTSQIQHTYGSFMVWWIVTTVKAARANFLWDQHHKYNTQMVRLLFDDLLLLLKQLVLISYKINIKIDSMSRIPHVLQWFFWNLQMWTSIMTAEYMSLEYHIMVFIIYRCWYLWLGLYNVFSPFFDVRSEQSTRV